jgi:hypothetical protein
MAKPKLALIPAAQGSKFYSVLPSDGVGDFDFARASAATRINKYGLIETVASGQSRLNYPLIDGVVNGCPHHILEPARTNLIPYSEDFSNVAWDKSLSATVSNSAISPDGSLNATKLITNNGSSNGQVLETLSKAASQITYTYSVFAKKGEWNGIGVYISDNLSFSNRGQSFFSLDGGLGTVSALGTFSLASSKIEEYANDWYRVKLTVTVPSTTTSIVARIYSLENVSGVGTGDGTSGIYIWGAQLEEGSYVTSYIVSNSGSATTRVAETAKNSGDASTFNDSEGVLYFEASAQDNSITTSVLSISNGSNVNSLYTGFSSSSNTIQAQLVVGGVAQTNMNYVVSDRTEFNKVAILYQNNNHKMYVNGVEAVVDTSGSVPSANTFDRLNFDLGQGSFDFYANVKQIQYYDSALNDSELETLTSWTSFSEMATSQLYSIQ